MEILVLDTNFKAVDIIDTYKSFIWTDRYNEYGDFEIQAPVNMKLLDTCRQDYYLWIKESEHMMIVENIEIASDVEDGNVITVTGRSLESILDRRIIWGQSNFNGNLQEAIKTLLIEAFISPKIAERKIPNFVFAASTDERITKLTIEAQYAGDELYSVISEQCKKNKIGFKITLDADNQFVFTLYAGADRSYDQTTNPYVIFSPSYENLLNSNYFTSKATYKNVTLVAGEGEGVNRKSTIVGSASGLDRRELYTDASGVSSTIYDDETSDEEIESYSIQTRDVIFGGGGTDDFIDDETSTKKMSDEEYNALLTTKGNESLAEYPINTAFEGEVEATQLFKYGEDFFVGDIVQITDDYGHEGTSYISELIISYDENGLSICPTFKSNSDKEEETR